MSPGKRRRPSQQSTHSSSSSPSSPPRKQQRSLSWPPSDGSPPDCISVYIVQAKLDSQAVSDLYSLVERHNNSVTDGPRFQVCNNVFDADIILTAVRMKKRLERHVDWDVARQKAIVTLKWLQDSVKEGHPLPCGNYAALKQLHEETASRCPDRSRATSPERPGSPPDNSSRQAEPMELIDTTSQKVKANYMSSYACARASPLICPNQELVLELSVLERSRELDGKSVNALSYARAMSVLKAFPYKITPEIYRGEVKKLPHLGEKMRAKIEEFLKHGFIEESRTIRASSRFQALSGFSSVYGVGPVAAQKLYDLGLRSIADMERYYDVPAADSDTVRIENLDGPVFTPNGKLVPHKSSVPDFSIRVGLALRRSFEIPIPRDEVEEIHRVVVKELNELRPGCTSIIVGGYRRGKPQNNDVDIVFSHSDHHRGAHLIKGLCQKLTKRLYDRGLVTHVMHLSGFHARDALRQGHWDSLEKALTVFVLPSNGEAKRIHRRVDLIFAAPEAYWTTIIGWSGSKMFQRDLRLWAKAEKGMKFDSTGLMRRHDSKVFIPKGEKDVFNILGLEWVHPIMRNADV
ncbi:hypothetical protein AX17_004600 [Amanita inopinata Kibby_2008]|nr:hypothetical protein AX17_004600 [Amanita inopinata Kibby_2008]